LRFCQPCCGDAACARRQRLCADQRHFAWRVCLDLDGEQPLANNFFDIYPGIPTVLPWPDNLAAPKILLSGFI
jgi:hypothetical protein